MVNATGYACIKLKLEYDFILVSTAELPPEVASQPPQDRAAVLKAVSALQVERALAELDQFASEDAEDFLFSFPVETGSPFADAMYRFAERTFLDRVRARPDDADPQLLLTDRGVGLRVLGLPMDDAEQSPLVTYVGERLEDNSANNSPNLLTVQRTGL